ncbi:hypothetical protein EVAR_90339_1 [Eumeta japonica]|uniref:Uncharacterized protein n=1 Tax=Eumeta variegata TaxID=151549 RepID=A0A4C1YJE0_EUMVA|nr:hypothetical protein EVAR_90339_1 [Eumeta japonica]
MFHSSPAALFTTAVLRNVDLGCVVQADESGAMGSEGQVQSAQQPVQDLENLIERLERVTLRLERLPLLRDEPGAPAHPGPAPPTPPPAVQQTVPEDDMSVNGYEDLLRSLLEINRSALGRLFKRAASNSFRVKPPRCPFRSGLLVKRTSPRDTAHPDIYGSTGNMRRDTSGLFPCLTRVVVVHSPLLAHFPPSFSSFSNHKYSIPTEEAGNALMIPLGLRVSMGDSDHLPSDKQRRVQ